MDGSPQDDDDDRPISMLGQAAVRREGLAARRDGRQQYLGIGKSLGSDKEWVQLQGKILLNSTGAKAPIYIEGPLAGVDVLLNSLVVKHAQKAPSAPAPDFEVIEHSALGFAFAMTVRYIGVLGPCGRFEG